MRNFYFRPVAALLATVAILPAFAADSTSFVVDGLSYTAVSDSTAMIIFDKSYEELTSVIVPQSINYDGKTYAVTQIDASCFNRCEKIKAITLPSTITEIGKSAFSGCYALERVNLEDTRITEMPNACFSACRKLQNITIPATVTSIYRNPFVQNLELKSINVEEGNPSFKSIEGVLFSISGKKLQAYPCGKATAYVVPEGTDSIGDEAFNTDQVLASITLANSVSYIGSSAFLYCDHLTTLVIPEESRLKKIMASAFSSCKILTGHLSLPETLTTISSNAFMKTSITGVTIQPGVTSIGTNAFSTCVNLSKLEIKGETLTSIGDGAFADAGITELVIPNSVTKVGMTAFSGCKRMAKMTIGTGLEVIQLRTFDNCNALKEIVCLNPTPPVCQETAKYPLFSETVISSTVLKVPAGSVDAYKAADVWKNFKTIETDNSGIKTVGAADDSVRICSDGILTDASYVEIYTISGQTVYKGKGGHISLPVKGIYVVRADGRTYKVAF